MTLDKIKKGLDSLLEKKIAPLSNQHKAAIAIGALVLPLLLFYFVWYSPKSEEITRLEGTKSSLQKEVQRLEARARNLPKLEAEMAETELRFKEASLLLPEQKEIPSLLTNISSLGTNSGLDVLTFKPGGERPKSFYAEIPVDIQVRGTYHNVGHFLDQVSKLPRIVTVSNLKMGSPGMADGQMLLSTNFDLVTYRFVEKPANEKTKKKK